MTSPVAGQFPVAVEFRAPRRRGSHARASGGGWTLFAALALLLGAFVMGNPPGQASDEPAHFFKAAALSVGHVSGEPVAIEGSGDWSPAMLAWVSTTARILSVPPGYAACDVFSLPQGGRCPPNLVLLDRPLPPGTAVSYVATYSPVPYVVPALAIRMAAAWDEDQERAVEMARLAGAAVALLLLTGAVRLLRVGRPDDLVGIAGAALALTPMVVFSCAQVSGSGLEISAGLCLGAALLRLSHPALEDMSARTAWAWTAVSGVLLVTARTLGPLWLVILLLVVLVLRGPRALARAGRAAPVAAAVTVVALGLALTAALLWHFLVEPQPDTSLGIALDNIPAAVAQLPHVADMFVGRLSWISIRLPLAVVLVWWLLLLGLLAVAAWTGTWRERLALGLSVVLAVGTTVFVWAYATAPTSPGFPMQARYTMPVLTMTVLVACDILRARAPELRRRWGDRQLVAAAAVLGCVALAHVAAFEVNATVSRVAWTPVLGWAVWEVVVAVAALLVVAGAIRVLRSGTLQRFSDE